MPPPLPQTSKLEDPCNQMPHYDRMHVNRPFAGSSHVPGTWIGSYENFSGDPPKVQKKQLDKPYTTGRDWVPLEYYRCSQVTVASYRVARPIRFSRASSFGLVLGTKEIWKDLKSFKSSGVSSNDITERWPRHRVKSSWI